MGSRFVTSWTSVRTQEFAANKFMSVTGIGYVVHNKARVALERALRNPRKRVLGVEWESILTFGFSPQGTGVEG